MAEGRKQLILEYVIQAQNQAASMLQQQNAMLAAMQKQIIATANSTTVMSAGFDKLDKSVAAVGAAIQKQASGLASQVSGHKAAGQAAKSHGDALDKLLKYYSRLDNENTRAVKGFTAVGRALGSISTINAPVVGAFNSLNKAVQTNATFMKQNGVEWNKLVSQFKFGTQVTPQLTAQLNTLAKAFQNVAGQQRTAAKGGGGGLFGGGGGGGAGGLGSAAGGASALSASSTAATNAVTGLGMSLFKINTFAVAAGQALFELAKNAVQGLVNSFKEGIDLSARFQNTFIGLETVARSFGQNTQAVNQAAVDLASDGLMRVDEAAQGLKNLLSTGFGLPEAIQLMKGFKDIAAFNRQAALDFGYAVTSATEGIKNQNSILVDNAGLTKNLSIIMKEAGLQLSDLARVSSDAGVRAKFFAGLMKEMSFSAGDAAKLMETFSGSVSRFGVQLQLMLVSLGDTITKNEAVKAAFAGFSELLVKITRAITDNQKAIGQLIAIGLGPLVSGLTAAGKAIAYVLDLFAKLQTAQKEAAKGFVGPSSTQEDTAKLIPLFIEVQSYIADARNEFSLFVQQVRSEVGSVIDSWTNLKNGVLSFVDSLRKTYAEYTSAISINENLKETLISLGNLFSTIIDIVGDLIKWVGSLTYLWKGLLAVFNAVISVVKFVSTTIEGLLRLLQWFFKETTVGQKIVTGLSEVINGFGIVLEGTADFVNMVANAWERLALLWRTAKPPDLPAPPPGFNAEGGLTNFRSQSITTMEVQRLKKEAEEGADKFIEAFRKVDDKLADTSKLSKKWLKENADSLAQIARDAQAFDLPYAEQLNAMAFAARKAGEAVVDTGKSASKAKSDLEQFQESVKNLNADLHEAARAHLSLEQVLRIFGSQINQVAAGAERFPRVNLGAAVRDAVDAMNAEKVKKFADQLLSIVEIPAEWGRLGDKFAVFKEAIEAVGGAANVSQTWLLANAEAIQKMAMTAEGQAVPALQELADKVRALTVANEDFARSQRIAENEMRAWEKVNQEIGDTLERSIDIQDEFFKLGRQTVDQQIRDAQKNLRNELRAIDDREDAFNISVRNMDEATRKQKANEIEATRRAFETERELIKAQSDFRIAETYGVSEQILKIWAKHSRDIAIMIEKARDAASPGGVLITPEEQAEIDKLLAKFAELRKRLLEIHKLMQPIIDKWNEWEDLATSVGQLMRAIGFGGIADDIDRIVGALKQAEDSSKKIVDGFILIAQGQWLAGIQNMIAGLAGSISAFKQATNSASRFKNAMGGAAVGAKIGETVGAGIGAYLGGPAGAAIGKFVGKWGGALVGGIIGAFRKPEWAKVQADVAKRFGVKISEELSKQIEATMKKLGDSFADIVRKRMRGEKVEILSKEQRRQIAESLNINSILQEAGGLTTGNLQKFVDQAVILFDRVRKGGEDAGQATQALDGFFSSMVDQMDRDFQGLIHPAMAKFIQQAKASGVEIKSISAFLKQMAGNALDAAVKVGKGFSGSLLGPVNTITEATDKILDLAKRRLSILEQMSTAVEGSSQWNRLKRELEEVNEEFETTRDKAKRAAEELGNLDPTKLQEHADRMGRILTATFENAISNGYSFMEALGKIAPAVDGLSEAQKIFGFETSEALARLIEMSNWANEHSELAESIDGLNDLVKGLANSLALTPQLFQDLGSEAVSQFEEMQRTGLGADEAMQAMRPTLQTLWELQKRFGYQVDAVTQSLIDQGVASGEVGAEHQTVQERMVDSIDRVVDRLDILIGKFGTMGGAVDEVGEKMSLWGRVTQDATDQAYNGIHGVIYGHSPGGITDLISHLDQAIDEFNNVGVSGAEAFNNIYESLQKLNDEFTESALSGISLEVFQLDRQHREAIRAWLDESKGQAQDIVDQGISLINATFENRMAEMQREQVKRLQGVMLDLDMQLADLTLNSAELEMYKLQVQHQQMIEEFLEQTKGASESFIQDGLGKIEQIFQLRMKRLRDTARGVQEIATQTTPVITLLGDGLLRIQGADVVFRNLNQQLSSASAMASTWGSNTVQQAEDVLDAVNAVSFGHSPGGLKEIPDKLSDAMDEARAFSAVYEREMDRIKRMVDDVGYAIDDRLTGDRSLNVDVNSQFNRGTGSLIGLDQQGGTGQTVELHVSFEKDSVNLSNIDGVNADNIDDKLTTAVMRAFTKKISGNDKDAVRFVSAVQPTRGRW